MSSPQVRRQDRVLPEAYIVPLLHVFSGDEIGVHNTAARGHLRTNVRRDGRACFEVDEPIKVFDYGRFECDSGLAYRSAIAYGRIRIVDDRAAKIRFFDALMAKYYPHHREALPAAASVRAVAGARPDQVSER